MKSRLFPQLDGLRALAALAVLIHHYWPTTFAWDPTGGRLGADLFFVLSGFLITRTLVQARMRNDSPWHGALAHFYKRRALRIFPMYYLTLLLVMLLRRDFVEGAVWWHLPFLSNYYFIQQGNFVGAASHFWTLAVEQHFYLFWPLIMLLVPIRHLRAAALGLIAAGIGFRAIAGLQGWSNIAIDVMTPGAFETLGMGAWLAVEQQRRPDTDWSRDTGLRWIALCGLILVALRTVVWGGTPVGDWLSLVATELPRALLLGWLVAQAIHGIPGPLGQLLQNTQMRLLGQASFGIYLTHNFFLAGLGIRTDTAEAIFALAITIAWALFCYTAIERPFLIHRRTS
jgi:peptidoglycan/LPS O-acetylase OafA/YrhL